MMMGEAEFWRRPRKLCGGLVRAVCRHAASRGFDNRDKGLTDRLAQQPARQWPAEDIALHRLDAEGLHLGELFRGLDSFGDQLDAELARDLGYAAHDRRRAPGMREVMGEFAIDLDLREREVVH